MTAVGVANIVSAKSISNNYEVMLSENAVAQ